MRGAGDGDAQDRTAALAHQGDRTTLQAFGDHDACAFTGEPHPDPRRLDDLAGDQRGWSAVQYCLTAPDGEWFYVHQSTVDEYGATGRCRLDPDMPSLG